MDPIGNATIIGATVCYILALQWAGVTFAWDSGHVVGTLMAWVMLMMIFVFSQWYQGERAMLVPRILRKRIVWACCAFIFL